MDSSCALVLVQLCRMKGLTDTLSYIHSKLETDRHWHSAQTLVPFLHLLHSLTLIPILDHLVEFTAHHP